MKKQTETPAKGYVPGKKEKKEPSQPGGGGEKKKTQKRGRKKKGSQNQVPCPHQSKREGEEERLD